SVFSNGYAILNADDNLVLKMREDLDCNVALFSMNEDNETIQEHCENGGLAAIVEKGYFTICKGEWHTRIAKVKDVPLTFSGKAECMVQNVLPAILTAAVYDFKIETIRAALKSFVPCPQTTPGRMNIFKFRNFEFMIDYAHNREGIQQL